MTGDYGKEMRMKFHQKALEIVDSLTLEEKIHLMSGTMEKEEVRGAVRGKRKGHYNLFPYPAGGIPEKGVPPMLFVDGPRGVACGTGKSTCFPVSMLRGATFDTELEEEIGEAIAEEVLAYGGNLYGGVCINLPYNPGWGRSQETYGEDSFHLGEMGAALVRGVQKHGVIACMKHFALNSMENSRFWIDIDCSKRAEQEVFLPHFKKCIRQGAGAVMSAYNSYKGEMCGHNSYLLRGILKEDWGFDGFVMSDFIWGVKDTAAAANGGQDIEMPSTQFYGKNLVQAVKEGKVQESVIDEAAVRIVRTLLAFQSIQEKPKRNIIGCPAHVRLALECAREGITLIQNRNRVLPLKREKVRKIAILGRLSQNNNTGDKGSSSVYPAYVVTAAQGITNAAADAEVICYEGRDLNHCRKLAREADAVIFVVGYNHEDEGEFVAVNANDVYTDGIGGDRKTGLGLHAVDVELIENTAPVNQNSVVVLIGGNAIKLDCWSEKVSAILMAYYPGMEGGTALGEIIFGDVNPSGKLPFVIPEREEDLPQVDWDGKKQFYEYFHGYRKLDHDRKRARVPYGFGLSYTTFETDRLKVWSDKENLYACCDVKNTGDIEGAEVLQMYVGFPESAVERPVKTLKGFRRVRLQPGEKRSVTIACPLEELCWFNQETGAFELEHMKYLVFMGTSSSPEDLNIEEINL